MNEILNILQQENIEELNDVFLKKLKQLQPDKFLSLSEETKEKVHDICEWLSQKSLEAFIFFKELHDKNQNEWWYTISKNELITLKLLLNNFKKEYESCGRKSKILIRLNKNISDAANFKPRINFMEIIWDYDDFMRIITK
ncbi:MAG: hypothetical protein ACD_4C00451G0001 [uncultured bacterium (gcode 4)]|uniref:Uncharacterized protein n=1 Tax=uncultured bacterium (gcode 4) TaxID=1234023 RepID=K2G7L7_9BACT|nr:MAG: hypothetical protein ACD_4C00451G0001 [uncultured bacterium (gcode 4)]